MYSQFYKKMHDFDSLVESRQALGLEWVWPKSDTDALDAIANDYKIYIDYILNTVKAFDVVVQAGGNCGIYPKLLSLAFKYVYTFEPDPLNFHCLVHNCQDNNIFKFNCCLGDRNRLVKLNSGNKLNIGCHIIDNSPPTLNTIYEVPTILIDQLALSKCDLLFLDVELFEHQALLGAYQTIMEFKPIIFLETNSPERNNQIDAFLCISLGYKLLIDFGKDRLYGPA